LRRVAKVETVAEFLINQQAGLLPFTASLAGLVLPAQRHCQDRVRGGDAGNAVVGLEHFHK
jgi:hypothetical protein